MSCWTRVISSYLAHKFKITATHINSRGEAAVGRHMLAGQTSHPHQLLSPSHTGTDAALQQNEWPLAPCCLTPVGREDNALSSVRLRLLWIAAVITDMRVQLAEVGLMERVKICFTIIRQHQDRCLSGTVGWLGQRWIGMEERTKGASHETTVDWQCNPHLYLVVPTGSATFNFLAKC